MPTSFGALLPFGCGSPELHGRKTMFTVGLFDINPARSRPHSQRSTFVPPASTTLGSK